MKKSSVYSKALTLLEVLGVVAVILTVATIAIISTKDTVSASQKAVAQREIQQLNTAVNNFKAAGGVFQSSTVDDILDALQGGVDLGAGDFTPLTEDPPLKIDIGGEMYNLTYDDEQGFSYQPASGSGSGIVGSGGDFSGAGTGSAFDYTNDADTAAAIEAFKSLPYGHPDRAGYIEGFSAAKAGGYLSPAEQTALDGALAGDGMVLTIDGNYVDAPFNFKDQADTQTALQNLQLGTPTSGTPEYEAVLIALDKGADAVPMLTADINDALIREFQLSVNSGTNTDIDWRSLLSGVSTPTVTFNGRPARGTIFFPPPPGYPMVLSVSMYENLTPYSSSLPTDLSTATVHYTNFSGVDLSSYAGARANFHASNFVGATMPADLREANLVYTQLAGVDLSGSSLQGAVLAASNLTGTILPNNLMGVNLQKIDLSGRDFSQSNLVNADLGKTNLSGTILPSDLTGVNLMSTDLSGRDLTAHILPKNLGYTNLKQAILPQNLSGFLFTAASLSGHNLAGKNLEGASLAGANLVGTVLPSNLSSVNFWGANLAGRVFTGSNLAGADLYGSSLSFANFAGARVSLNTKSVTGAVPVLDADGNGTWTLATGVTVSVQNWLIQQ